MENDPENEGSALMPTHDDPCPELREVATRQAVVLRRLEEHDLWQKRQNGSLEHLVEQHDRDRETALTRHAENRAAIADLRWQMKLGFICLGLIAVSEHPVFAGVWKALGL